MLNKIILKKSKKPLTTTKKDGKIQLTTKQTTNTHLGGG